MYKLVIAALILFALPRVADAQTRPIRGVFQFSEYTEDGSAFVGYRPVRYATVTIKRGSTTVGTAMTGHDGYFSRYIDVAQLPVGQPLTVEMKPENFAAHVYLDMDWENAEITFRETHTITSGTGEINFSNAFTFTEGSHHLSILDACTYGRQYADARRDDTDDVQQVDVEYPEDSDHYGSFWDEIKIQGPPMPGHPEYGGGTVESGWRDSTVIHEYAHHLESTISDLYGSDGGHPACDAGGHTYAAAWQEGFATYYAWAVCEAYPAGLQPIAPEEQPPEQCPAQSEEATRQALWDLHDPANETWDLVNGARVLSTGKDLRRIIFEVLDHEQENDIPYPYQYLPTTILSFHDAWVARNLYRGSHVELDRVLLGFGIVPHAYPDVYPISLTSADPTVPAGAPLTVTTRATQSNYIYLDEPLYVRYSLVNFYRSYQLGTVTRFPFTSSSPFNINLVIPSNVVPGNYWVVAELDYNNRMVESNETNNSISLFVTIEPAPPPVIEL